MSYPLFVYGQPPALPAGAVIIADPREATGDYYLAWREEAFFLCDRQKRHQPLTLDFAGKSYQGRAGAEFLPKTLRGLAGEKIADVTAGWGKDAWLLARSGFSLTLYERNPYLFTLLAHGLAKARENPQCAEIAGRITLCQADAAHSLPHGEFAAVYLDPMYPERRKKAKVKKHMQALQQLLGAEEKDEEKLLAKAFAAAKQRVIVKRPQGAPFINGEKPSYMINSPNTRYDVYQLFATPRGE